MSRTHRWSLWLTPIDPLDPFHPLCRCLSTPTSKREPPTLPSWRTRWVRWMWADARTSCREWGPSRRTAWMDARRWVDRWMKSISGRKTKKNSVRRSWTASLPMSRIPAETHCRALQKREIEEWRRWRSRSRSWRRVMKISWTYWERRWTSFWLGIWRLSRVCVVFEKKQDLKLYLGMLPLNYSTAAVRLIQ